MNKGGNHSVGLTRPSHRKAGPAQPPLATAGFTIVETLIVLAVTAFLFASVVLLISGRQQKTEFQTAINSIEQQMQQIINQTASGYFPGTNNFTCEQVSPSSPPHIDETATGNGQGTNGGCVFLGKVIFLGTFNAAGDEQFITWPIVGNQNIGSAATQTINGVFPQPIDIVSETGTLSSGLTTYYMRYTDSAGTHHTAGVGFLAGDSSGQFAGAGGDGLASGSQQLSLYAISGTKTGSALAAGAATDKGTMFAALQSNSAVSNNYAPASSVEICFGSGTTDQSGLLTIGSDSTATTAGRQLTVTLKIYGGQTC